jgi:hypothetical protein
MQFYFQATFQKRINVASDMAQSCLIKLIQIHISKKLRGIVADGQALFVLPRRHDLYAAWRLLKENIKENIVLPIVSPTAPSFPPLR